MNDVRLLSLGHKQLQKLLSNSQSFVVNVSSRGSKVKEKVSLLLLSYLSPRSGKPLQPFVLGAAPQDAGLMGFGFVVLSAHAVGHHRCDPRVGAAAKHASLPQSPATGL